MGALHPLPEWSRELIQPAQQLDQRETLPSGIELLDRFLEGGLPVGALTEWGMPFGFGGREILIPWIRHMTRAAQPQWALWVHRNPQLEIYPPAWAARGVALEKIRFARTSAPLKDLRPVFLEPLFKLIIIDNPESFSGEDYSFIARQARRLRQVVVVLRQDHLGDQQRGERFLRSGTRSGKRGKWRQDEHIWSPLRLNLWSSQPSFVKGARASFLPESLFDWGGEWEEGVEKGDGDDKKRTVSLRGATSVSGPRDRSLWIEVVRGLSPRFLKISSNRIISV